MIDREREIAIKGYVDHVERTLERWSECDDGAWREVAEVVVEALVDHLVIDWPWFSDDEDPADIQAAFDLGEKGVTGLA